jgi:CheY-like chemotaxis protein
MSEPRPILLVDDDADDVYLFCEVLKSIDPQMPFLSAVNGVEAMSLLQSVPKELPWIIFLDLNMPKMDGRECLRLIKANAILKAIPVVIYTTSRQPADAQQMLQMGAEAYVTKPNVVQDIREMLKKVLTAASGDLKAALQQMQELHA